jgi:hypothetical protein
MAERTKETNRARIGEMKRGKNVRKGNREKMEKGNRLTSLTKSGCIKFE